MLVLQLELLLLDLVLLQLHTTSGDAFACKSSSRIQLTPDQATGQCDNLMILCHNTFKTERLVGTEASFSCSTSGEVTFTRHDGYSETQINSTSDRFSITGQTLQISNIKPEDEGQYRCTSVGQGNEVLGCLTVSGLARFRTCDTVHSFREYTRTPTVSNSCSQHLNVTEGEDVSFDTRLTFGEQGDCQCIEDITYLKVRRSLLDHDSQTFFCDERATNCSSKFLRRESDQPYDFSIILPSVNMNNSGTYYVEVEVGVPGEDTHRTFWKIFRLLVNRVNCVNLSSPVNGQLLLALDNIKLMATYICDAGYFLVGNETRVCLTNSTWSGSPPVCIIHCGNLPDPFNGHVRINMDKLLGSSATYSCNQGYTLTGDAARLCQSGRVWSGVEPECKLQANDTQSAVAISVGLSFTLLMLVGISICLLCCWKRRSQTSSFGTKIIELNDRSIEPGVKNSSGRWDAFQSQIQEAVDLVPQSLRIPRSHLKMSAVSIGQGEFGIVYKGILMNWNDVPVQGVAVKALKGLFTLNDVQNMVNEILKTREFNHPHVLSLIGVCLDSGPGVSMIMPFMSNGSLLDYLKKERSNLETNKDEPSKVLTVRKLLLRMCHQIALGMEYLAEQKFIHRDLAARNCMLDSDGNIKVGDFGLAEDIYTCGYFRQKENSHIRLPYKWMALESLTDSIFTEKTDVWSYGVTIWEIFSMGRNPYPAVDPMSLIQLLKDGRRLDNPQITACSPEISAVMARCWYTNSEERPDFSELCSIMDQFLSVVSDYTEMGMALTNNNEMDVMITENVSYTDHDNMASTEDYKVFSVPISVLTSQDQNDSFDNPIAADMYI